MNTVRHFSFVLVTKVTISTTQLVVAGAMLPWEQEKEEGRGCLSAVVYIISTLCSTSSKRVYITLSKMMTLFSSVPGEREAKLLMSVSGAMYSRW